MIECRIDGDTSIDPLARIPRLEGEGWCAGVSIRNEYTDILSLGRNLAHHFPGGAWAKRIPVLARGQTEPLIPRGSSEKGEYGVSTFL